MKLTIDTTSEQDAALQYAVDLANKDRKDPISAEQYLSDRIAEVMASYAQQAGEVDGEAVKKAFVEADAAKRVAIKAAVAAEMAKP